jgi:hypothetical protein
MKPRSTTWFCKFLIEQYDDDQWLENFRMTKASVFSLANLLWPLIEKKDTNYRSVVPVVVLVVASFFKLTQSCSLQICMEMFAIGKSTMCVILRDFVQAVNVLLRVEISWLTGQPLLDTMRDFQDLCGLLAIVGAIDETHINITKPVVGAEYYYYFKNSGYTLNC